jgi:hypothetical protein
MTYKDGKRVSEKHWNSNGEEVETNFESLLREEDLT